MCPGAPCVVGGGGGGLGAPDAKPTGGVLGQGNASSGSQRTCCLAAPRLRAHGVRCAQGTTGGVPVLVDCQKAQVALP